MSEKVERLVNLTVALLEARRPLTLREIRTRIPGYRQQDGDSARRMFERDKDDLRRLGVPIETRATDAFETDWGYIVDRQSYAAPEVELDPDEVAALSLALQVTGEDVARLGLAKLLAHAPEPADRASPAARVDADVAAIGLPVFAQALVERCALRFEYRTASGERGLRTVDPYAVVQRRGDWYVVGRDHARDDVRAFRTDRIVSTPEAAGPPRAFDVPEGLDLRALVSGPAGERVDAEVAIAPATAWQASGRGGTVVEVREDGWTVARFVDVDGARLLGWVMGLGEDAEVIAPAALRQRAAEWLRTVAQPPTTRRAR